ncbi:MAG: hypothetical protein ACE5G0_21205 [Rhodothermales bacterium]
MIIPVGTPTPPAQPDTDHRDLITALKLLSGQECKRDAAQAQVLLVGLTESRHDDVAQDARVIMQAGLSRGWFEDTAPKYYELRMLAERAIANYENRSDPRRKQLALLLVGGLVAFIAGVLVYARTSGSFSLPPGTLMFVIVGLMVVAAGVLVFIKAKQ